MLKKIITLCLAILFAAYSPATVFAMHAPDLMQARDFVETRRLLNTAVWSLEHYLTWYAAEGPYDLGGGSEIDIVEIDGVRGLRISERMADWVGVPIRYGGSGAGRVVPHEGDIIIIIGQIVSPEEGTQIELQTLHGSNISGPYDVDDNGFFILSHTLTDESARGFNSFTIVTSGTEDFYIYSVDVFRDPAVYAEQPNWDLSAPSLAEAFAEYFLMGNIWSNRGQMSDVATFDMFSHHYNSVTASNHHKVSFLLGSVPNAWDWDFNLADSIVDWAEDNELAMVGHTLVWHSQSRPWLAGSPGNPLTRQEAIENMHKYISTVAGRYRGRMYSWDVVNEVISTRGSWWGANPDWRVHLRRPGQGLEDNHTHWYAAFANGAVGDECGSDYIYYAFRFARIYDPYAILYYNDYNTFASVKRQAIAQMVVQINERWTNDPLYDGRLLIEGIGMQGHYNLRNWPANIGYVRTAIEEFVQTGARVSLTELNVYLEGGGIVPTDDLLPELFEEQARRYYQLFELFLEFADYIPRVTSFIWVDLPAEQGAWRRWPHSQRPALFDVYRQTKPAFYAVLQTLENAAPANISVPEVITSRIPRGEAGEQFSAQLRAQQTNHAPIRWHVDSGELPPGLRLIAATGAIIGTPTQEGAFTFTIAAENARGRGVQEFTMAVGYHYDDYIPQPEVVAVTAVDDDTDQDDQGSQTSIEEPYEEPSPPEQTTTNPDYYPEYASATNIIWIIAAGVIGVVIIAFFAKNKKKEETKE